MTRNILLVDDDAAIRDTLVHHLGRAGFTVTAADAAEPALAMLGDVDPDVIITDVRMPGMNGLELVALLRERVPDLNVVVITAYEDMETAVRAMRAGAFDYLVKPLDLDQIELVLNRAIRDRQLRLRLDRIAEDEGRRSSLDQLAGRDPKELFAKDGLLDDLKKALSERILNAELDEHLGLERAEGGGNRRNGTSKKTVLTGTSKLTIAVPRDPLPGR